MLAVKVVREILKVSGRIQVRHHLRKEMVRTRSIAGKGAWEGAFKSLGIVQIKSVEGNS